ncbi:MAG TPA: hypothetical protein VFE17_05605 [Candidatus Baltobacteraceae bacterium]|nr:hypothetical protein [Candidatus Baltobacteraceae bacterium]
MTAEWVSAFAALGTLLVIAATAFAALVQLRHIRSANQLSGLLHFTAVFESDEIQHANVFIAREIPAKLRDPEFLKGLLETNTDRREHPELRVCDFLEQQGSYIKFGMIEKGQYIDLVGAYIRSMWDALQPVVALRRVARNSGAMYENFEYLASLAAADKVKPQVFPRGVAVLMDEGRWRELARQTIATANPPD